jgi:two-component system response regulator protein BraR/BceR
MYRILLVEDDATIVEVLKRQLEKWSYTVKAVRDFEHVMEEVQAFAPSLVLMDISLPFYNGYYWCGELRKISRVPVIFISSAGEDMNLIMAIQMGADDFIAKPFKFEVVLAKIQAILRRTYDFGEDPRTLSHRGVTLNLGDGSVSFKEEKLALSKNEFKILELLMEKKGNVVLRDDLIEELWNTEDFIDDNTLTVNVGRLRRRLESIGIRDFIITKKSLGYLIEE